MLNHKLEYADLWGRSITFVLIKFGHDEDIFFLFAQNHVWK